MKNNFKKVSDNVGNTQTKGSTYMQWLTGILVNCTALTYGMQNGWISPMAKILKSDLSPTGRPLTDTELSMVASAPAIVATICVTIYSVLVDKYGRKAVIMIVAAIQAISWIIKLCPLTVTSLIVARIFTGIGAGGTFNIIPIYIKEISQENIRGTLGFIMVMAQNIGILAVYAMGAYLDYYTLIWIALVIPVICLVLMIIAPESPTYLVKVGKHEEAASTLAKLKCLEVTHKEVQNEIDLIGKEDDAFKSIPNISFSGIFKVKPWRQGFLIMIMVIFAHACNGAFSVLNHAATIFKSSEVNVSPEIQALSVPIFMIITCIAFMFIVDKLGRKTILAAAFALSSVAFGGLASMLLIQQYGGSVPGWLVVFAIILAMCCYAAGVLPLPFIIMSEMFNFQIKAKLIGCIVTVAWSTSFVQLFAFTLITNAFGAHTTFYFFAAINLLGVAVTLIMLPETKGKTVEEIEEALRTKK